MALQRESGNVRMGPVSIIVLVIVLCLAVLATLTAATAQASYLEAKKQADITQSTYANEVAGQEFLAKVDASLAESQSKGYSRDQALKALEKVLPDETSFDGSTLSLAFMSSDGRTLSLGVKVRTDLTYSITHWKTTTRWEADDAGSLWESGS